MPAASHLPGEMFHDGLQLSRGIDRAMRTGYAFISPGVSSRVLEALDTEADRAGQELDHSVGSQAIPEATLVAKRLGERIRELRFRHPVLKKWWPVEAVYQFYDDPQPPAPLFQNDNNFLTASVVVRHTARVGMYAAIPDPLNETDWRRIDEYHTQPGMIIVKQATLASGERLGYDVAPESGRPQLLLNLRCSNNEQPHLK